MIYGTKATDSSHKEYDQRNSITSFRWAYIQTLYERQVLSQRQQGKLLCNEGNHQFMSHMSNC